MKKVSNMKAPNAIVVIMLMIVLAGILTYIIPAGQYADMVDPSTGRTVTDPSSFQYVEQNGVSFFGIFEAIPNGIIASISVGAIVLVYGASFGIINSTQVFEIALNASVDKLRRYSLLIIPAMSFITSLLGAFLGISESCMAFIPLFVLVAKTMGYDAIVGFSMCMLGNILGFTAGPMNYWTAGIAQGIAELPLYSGLGMRLFIYAVLMVLGVGYTMVYARRIQADPTRSIMYDAVENAELSAAADAASKALPPFTTRKKVVLTITIAGFLGLIYGLTVLGWWDGAQIGGYLLVVAIVVALVDGKSLNDIADGFVQGAHNVLLGALMVGMARGILIILEGGMVVDTILHAASGVLGRMPRVLAAIFIYIFQFFFNFLVPSGSGQAAVTMPLIAPLADMVGITRQTAVIAFQLGDGFTNMLWPTAAMSYLAIANIPYNKWIKFFMPLVGMVVVFCCIIVTVCTVINLGPF